MTLKPQPPTSIGEKQTIQARHGVATFVPKGHMIKIINTYGKQVVDTWAFALNAPPEDGDIHRDGNEVKEESSKTADKGAAKETEATPSAVAEKAEESAGGLAKEGQKVTEKTSDAAPEAESDVAEEAQKTSEKVGEKVGEKVTEKVPEGAKKRWSSYLPSVRRGTAKAPEAKTVKAESSKETEGEEVMAKSWSSYLPSIRGMKDSGENTNSQSKGWSSYIPSGVAFSSYIPDKGTLSGFAQTHSRDPTKSYAEQLYDFSKTPVGAAGLSGEPVSLRIFPSVTKADS
jgi:hypothetical protein